MLRGITQVKKFMNRRSDMTRFTAFTRVLSRWLTYGVFGAIALWLWGLAMVWIWHLTMPSHPGCDGSLFNDASHIPMVFGATVWVGIFGLGLWGFGIVLKQIAIAFQKAVVQERGRAHIRR